MADTENTEAGDDGMSEEERVAAEWAAMADEDAAPADGEAGDAAPADAEAEISDDEKAAAEWAAMEDDDTEDDSGATAPARVLNQDEIDSLLGFDGDAGNSGANSGINALLNNALVSYERLPMLEVVFDRLVRLLTTSMRNFTSDNVEVSLDNITSIRFGDYLNSVPLPAMLTVFKADLWDNHGLLTIDSALIYSIVDVLLGGRKGTSAMRIEGRPYTTIERTLVERMIYVVLEDLSAAFEPLSPVNFIFDRMETNPRFATIARPANVSVVARLHIDMDERGGKIDLLLPYATLEPVRELLLQMFMGEKFGRDPIWENHLARELWHTDMEIEAVLGGTVMTLDDVLNLSVGSQIMLKAEPGSDIELRCGEISLFKGKMGRKRGNMAVRIEQNMTTMDKSS